MRLLAIEAADGSRAGESGHRVQQVRRHLPFYPSALGQGLSVAAASAYALIEALEMAVPVAASSHVSDSHLKRLMSDHPAKCESAMLGIGSSKYNATPHACLKTDACER